MSEEILNKVASHRKSARKAIGGAMLVSILVHVAIAIVGGIWIVATYYKKEEPKFVSPPPPAIKIPPQTREHRMNLAAHKALAAKPTFKARLVSLRPTEFALPDAPKVNIENMLTPDPSAIASQIVTGLAGAAGSGTGFGQGGAGGKGIGTAINFMGIDAEGERIILIFDVSRSVVNKANSSGVPLARIKEETITLIEKLPVDSRFNIIQFVRNYKPFQQELVPATAPNRELAKKWIEEEWSESGMMSARGAGVISPKPNGLLPVLRFAYKQNPDTIFLVSDGSFQSTGGPNVTITEDEFDELFKELNSAPAGKIPLYFIGFQMRDDDEKYWSRKARRQGGKMRAIN